MEVIRTHYADGQLNEEYRLINNKIEGLYKRYHTNGQLWVICNYVDGKINGEYKEYSEDGILISHTLYENDVIIQTIL